MVVLTMVPWAVVTVVPWAAVRRSAAAAGATAAPTRRHMCVRI